MNHEKRNYVIAYDVTDLKRLKRINKCLKRFATPIQLSVFLLHGTEEEFQRALKVAQEAIDLRKDDLRAYALPSYGRRFALGKSVFAEGIHFGGIPSELLTIYSK